jgi:hypothetical protein
VYPNISLKRDAEEAISTSTKVDGNDFGRDAPVLTVLVLFASTRRAPKTLTLMYNHFCRSASPKQTNLP